MELLYLVTVVVNTTTLGTDEAGPSHHSAPKMIPDNRVISVLLLTTDYLYHCMAFVKVASDVGLGGGCSRFGIFRFFH